MSSFVVAKKEYIKAGGYCAGLSEALGLWVFDYRTYRNMTSADYYEKFTEFYTMNALSVQEQYNDAEPCTNSQTYEKEFEQYRKLGKRAGITRENLKEQVAELAQFFNGCQYQTEKESYMFQMQMFFDHFIAQLIKYLVPGYEAESWGTLELTNK